MSSPFNSQQNPMKKRLLKDNTTTGYQAEITRNSFATPSLRRSNPPRGRHRTISLGGWHAVPLPSVFTHRDHPDQSSLHHRRPKPGDIAMKTYMDQLPRVVPANFH
jgi:hypothetical protein